MGRSIRIEKSPPTERVSLLCMRIQHSEGASECICFGQEVYILSREASVMGRMHLYWAGGIYFGSEGSILGSRYLC